MKIKRTLLLLAFIVSSFASFSQGMDLTISHDKTHIGYIKLYIGDVIFSVSPRGDVGVITGTTVPTADQKHPVNRGKRTSMDNLNIDYYDNFNANYAGKLKSIGDINITYYDQFDGLDNRGRVKRIGDVKFAYKDRFDGFDNRGKVKAIGDVQVAYYDKFDGSDLNGKVKSIGNTVIKYYDRFDGSDKLGRIKSVSGKTSNVSISNISDDEFAE
jgi:hypothetical protein